MFHRFSCVLSFLLFIDFLPAFPVEISIIIIIIIWLFTLVLSDRLLMESITASLLIGTLLNIQADL